MQATEIDPRLIELITMAFEPIGAAALRVCPHLSLLILTSRGIYLIVFPCWTTLLGPCVIVIAGTGYISENPALGNGNPTLKIVIRQSYPSMESGIPIARIGISR